MQGPTEFNYVTLFKDEFFRRKENNRLYSLRAFAQHLEISPAYVSLVFRGKRHLSPSTAAQVAKKLKWSREKQKYFVHLLEFENSKSEQGKEMALDNLQKLESAQLPVHSIDADTFAAISIWYHNSIIALLTSAQKKLTTIAIAKTFSLNIFECESALRRLQRLGLVEMTGRYWSALHDYIRVNSYPSQAIRLYHKNLLAKAATAIDEQNFEQRDFSNMTLSVDPSQIPLAKTKIAQFHNEMAKLFESKTTTKVYQLSVQLFELSTPTENQSC